MKERIKRFKERYNSHEPIYREYRYYGYRYKIALLFISLALIFFILDLFFVDMDNGIIYYLNMLLFFILFVVGFCVGLSGEIRAKEYKKGVLYHYDYTILGFLPKLTKKEKKKANEFLESRHKTSISKREPDKD